MEHNTNTLCITFAILSVIKMAEDECILTLRKRYAPERYHHDMDLWYEELAIGYINEVWSQNNVVSNEGQELTWGEQADVWNNLIRIVVETLRARVATIDLMNAVAKI